MPKIYGKMIVTSRQMEPQACDENGRPLNCSLIPTLGAANFKSPNSFRINDDVWDAVQSGQEYVFDVTEGPVTYAKRDGTVVTEDQVTARIWTKNAKLADKWLDANESLMDGTVSFGKVPGIGDAKMATVNAKAEAIRKALAAVNGGTAPVTTPPAKAPKTKKLVAEEPVGADVADDEDED